MKYRKKQPYFHKVTGTICTILLLVLMAGCHEDWQFTALLDQVDSLMNTHPDSALALLQTKTDTIGHLPESQRMRYSLLTAKAQNKAYVKMCNIAYFYHFPPRHSYSFSGEVGVT